LAYKKVLETITQLFKKQRATTNDLIFEFSVLIKDDAEKKQLPKFLGDFVQGSSDKFVYVGIGTYAGQFDSAWSRRLKVPLTGITWEQVEQFYNTPNAVLETYVPGTGKDGSPNCATVKPFAGWLVKE
jgi:Family of unknown function (DUF5990)